MIEWKDECLKEGDPKVKKQKSLRTTWNMDKPADGAWWEDFTTKYLKLISYSVEV